MMKIWLVAGASSGVGKSTLVKNLSEVLPNAVRMKLGHGKRRKKGPSNYFTSTEKALDFIGEQRRYREHCIVEGTRLVGLIEADIVIFLDQHNENRRDDAAMFRNHADIILGRGGNEGEWLSVLKRLEMPVKITKQVIEIFEAQNDFLSGNRMAIRTKVWFGIDGKVVFGEGLARLLRGIDEHGSLSKAASAEGISYRHAWGDIKRAEERLGFKFLERQTGGKSGGGSRLTRKGRRLLEGYETLKRRIIRESNVWFQEVLNDSSD